MKNRDLFLPSVTTLVISAMLMFLSCAHQGPQDNDGLTETEQSVSDAGTETKKQDISDVTELTEGEASTKDAATTASNEEINKLTTDEGANKAQDPTLDALGAPSDSELQGKQIADTGTETTTANTEAQLGSTTPQADPSMALGTETAANATPTPEPMIDIPPANPSSADNLGVASNEALQPIPSHPELDTPKAAYSPGSARAPKIPTKALVRKGTTLNRFYFARKGDSAKSVSKLIYGDTSRASTLKSWNGGTKKWAAGKLIYYSSPTEAEDKAMRSFYQERNVPSEDYEVKRGDWLSRIAQRKLGNAGSWKEIAVVNGMASPDSLEVGQKLAIYPADLSGYSFENYKNVAEKEELKEEPVAKQEAVRPQVPVKQEPLPNPAMQPELAPPVAEAMPGAPVEEGAKKGNKSQKLDVSKLVEQNLFTIVIGGGVIVLLLALSAINRRKKGRGSDDFGDEGFAAPTKLKRK